MRNDKIMVIATTLILILAGILAGVRSQRVQAAMPPWIDCKKFAPKPLVKDYDGRLWLVDICAVVQDDAGASQYKTEVKQK